MNLPMIVPSSKVSVIYPRLVHDKIMHWVGTSHLEVSGFCTAELVSNEVRVLDAFILDEGSSAETTISAADCSELAESLESRGTPGMLKLWWHSHVNMGVFWSGTDMQAMTELSEHGWFSFTVFNKRGEMRSALGLNQPVRLILDELPTVIRAAYGAEVVAAWQAEYELIKAAPRAYNPLYGGTASPHWSDQAGHYEGDYSDTYSDASVANWSMRAYDRGYPAASPALPSPNVASIGDDKIDAPFFYSQCSDKDVAIEYLDMFRDGMKMAQIEAELGRDNIKRCRAYLAAEPRALAGSEVANEC